MKIINILKKLYIAAAILIIVATMIMIAHAEDTIFKQGQLFNISAICTYDGALCQNGNCNITLFNPNGVLLINNQQMTANNALFNFTYSSQAIGSYKYATTCCQNASCTTQEDYFVITFAGYEKPDRITIVVASGIIALLLILLAIFTNEPKFYPFKIAFAVLAIIDALIIIPTALISDSIVMDMFAWGLRISQILTIGIIALILIVLGKLGLEKIGIRFK